MSNVVFDEILGKIRAGDVSGGTSGGDYIGGFGISIEGQTVNKARYMPVETVSGSSVTLMAGHAYKVYATSEAISLNTETVPANQFGLEGHLEIFVAGTGYVVTGTNVVLANALEPDSVNNCTVRFHDGYAIISVEDHIAGYIVFSATGSTAGTLPYALSSASQEYVAFDASLDGSTFDLGGVTTNSEKHVVGNGYTSTTLTGAVDCGTSKFTVANLALSDVQIAGGVMTFGDAYIPSGSTVVVSGGGLAIEKVTGNGGTIDLGGTNVVISYPNAAYASGCTFTGGAAASSGGVMIVSAGASARFVSCVISSNGGTRGALAGNGSFDISGCTITENTNGGFFLQGGAQTNITSSVVSGNSNYDIRQGGASARITISDSQIGYAEVNVGGIVLTGVNTVDRIAGSSGTVTLSSGAIVDLTGNSNAAPIAPGGAITIPAGAVVTIIGSGGPTSSAYLSELALTGSTITNAPEVLGATVTIPANGETYDVHFADGTSSTYTGGETERQEVLSGAVVYIGVQ